MLPSILSLLVLEEICGRRQSPFPACLCGYLTVVILVGIAYFTPQGIPAGYLEPVWGCLCLAGHLWLRPDDRRVRQFVLLWLSLVCHDLAAEMLQSHILSAAHIYVSWIARITILMAVLDILFHGRTKALTVSLSLQGASIILGMFWAFDAPGWDSLWHWDYIETCALFTWLALWALYRTQDRFWTYTILFIQIIQSLVLYAHLGMSDISSHQYVSGARLEWLLGHALWMIGVIYCRGPNHTKGSISETILMIERTTGFLMLGLIVIGGFVTSIVPYSKSLTVFVGLTWIILIGADAYFHRTEKWILIFVGLLVIIPVNFLNVQFDIFRIKTNEGKWNLYGIHLVQKTDECTNYQFLIDTKPQIIEIPYTLCKSATKPSQYKYFYHDHHIMRAQIIEYMSKDGLLMRKSDVGWQLIYMIFLILLWIPGTVLGQKKDAPWNVLLISASNLKSIIP